MGWDFGPKPEGKMIDFFRQRMGGENKEFIKEVLDCVKVNSVAYLAVRYTDKVTGKSSVDAVVCPTSVRQGAFGYKDIHECMEPYYYDCPERILRQLSPLEPGKANEGALRWREACRANLMKNKARIPLQAGDRLLFNESISFQQGNLKLRDFQMQDSRKLVFQAEHGGLVRLTRALVANQEDYSIFRDGKVILDNRNPSALADEADDNLKNPICDETEEEACGMSPR